MRYGTGVLVGFVTAALSGAAVGLTIAVLLGGPA